MTPRYSEFTGKHVLVTGAGQGIGRAIAYAFADQGARVSALSRGGDNLDQTDAYSDAITALPCDLIDPAASEAAVMKAMAERGPVSVLVNNAGRDTRIDFDNLTPELFREMLAINLDHHHLLARLVAPGMRELERGAIINMTSTAWMKIAGDLTAYHTAKAAIVGLTRGLARDLGSENITVNAIAPGRVFIERSDGSVTEEYRAETRRIQCIPELMAPSDVAAATLFLASESARFITAQTLIVDGGVV